MSKEQILGVARHILTAVGGVFVSKGSIGDSELEILVGSVLGIAGVVWSLVAKRRANRIEG